MLGIPESASEAPLVLPGVSALCLVDQSYLRIGYCLVVFDLCWVGVFVYQGAQSHPVLLDASARANGMMPCSTGQVGHAAIVTARVTGLEDWWCSGTLQ